MPKAFAWILAAVTVLVLALFGLAIGVTLLTQSPPSGALVTDLDDVSVSAQTTPGPIAPPTPVEPTSDRRCWPTFGGDPRRTLARPDVALALPRHKPTWTRAMGDLMEYPPTYCDGRIYVNLEHGATVAVDAESGRLLWKRGARGKTASSPAIAGDRLIVSSHGGTVTAFRRTNGERLWQLESSSAFESSPVAVGGVAFVGGDDGRLFALDVLTGKPRWVYDLGGRISSSPSVVGGTVCITTYSGAVACLRQSTGERVWIRYFKRDPLRYESFYASASSDGRRLFTASRSGHVLALDAATGDEMWRASTGALVYGTPAVAEGRVFVADLGRRVRAYRASDGQLLWETDVSGRVLGPTLVVGKYVFFSTLESDTYAARVSDGKVVWHIALGKYAPGIATERHYYLSLNGRLSAYDGRRSAS
jgi:outer membrane protein assembly factor BamB